MSSFPHLLLSLTVHLWTYSRLSSSPRAILKAKQRRMTTKFRSQVTVSQQRRQMQARILLPHSRLYPTLPSCQANQVLLQLEQQRQSSLAQRGLQQLKKYRCISKRKLSAPQNESVRGPKRKRKSKPTERKSTRRTGTKGKEKRRNERRRRGRRKEEVEIALRAGEERCHHGHPLSSSPNSNTSINQGSER